MQTIKSIPAKSAALLDTKLMGEEIGYTIDQLMELAGLSVAQSVSSCIDKSNEILVICGPGNNGGDGLVTARHLYLFGHKNISFHYPIKSKAPIFDNLLKQLKSFDITEISQLELNSKLTNGGLIIIDSLFGFSFHKPLRSPFDSIVKKMTESQLLGSKIFSIDVPSGWDVNDGPSDVDDLNPDGLISLTCPKPCSKFFKGEFHFLGGRFIPNSITDEFKLNDILKLYKSYDQFVNISNYKIE